jgi:glycosyltransferase involved in cell wall biosynthesis
VALHELWPEAPVYTLVHDPAAMGETFADWDIRTSFLQRLPGGVRHHQKLIALMPRAVESLRFDEFDLIVSDSSAWVKSLRFGPGAVHVCYCHSPARFLWHWSDEYIRSLPAGRVAKWAARAMVPRLRAWDLRTCTRPTHYLANSRTAAERIRQFFGLEATVIEAPVNTARFTPEDVDEDHYLVVGALNPYKRVDLAIEAFNELRLPLLVVGDGALMPRLRELAGPTVKLLGKVSEEDLRRYYARYRAFIMPQEEDFGIAPLEAMSAGRPVIAYGAGGALETVVERETGLFFAEQTPQALIEAVRRFQSASFDKQRCRRRALEFDTARFKQRVWDYVSHVTAGEGEA